MRKSTLSVWLLLAGESVEVEVSSKKAVCEECDGEGKVGRFDHDVFTLSDFEGDEEEMSDFASHCAAGTYDVTCPECKGNKVVSVPDLSDLTPEQLVGYRAQQERDDYFRAEQASERRMGC